MARFFCFGEILWDLFPDGPRLGGAPFNQAVRLRGLGNEVVFVSRVGDDDLGRKALCEARSLGVDTTFIQRDTRHPTGAVKVTLESGGNPRFRILPGAAYDFIEYEEGLSRVAAESDCIVFGTLVQRTAVSRRALYAVLEANRGKRTLLDVNLRRGCYTRTTVRRSLEYADLLRMNEEEVKALAGMFGLPGGTLRVMEALIERFALEYCVATLAERGALGLAASGRACYVAGYRVKVADTCGSGDAFTAGFVDALERGASLEEALEAGCRLGALAAMVPGGTGRLPRSLRSRGRVVDSRYRHYI